MRILHCIPSMEGGGAERQLTYLAAGLRRLGEDVHVAVVSRGPNWERLVTSGAVVHLVRARGTHDPRLFWRLLRLMRAVNADIVQLWLRQMEILGGCAAAALRKPFIVTERSSEGAYPATVKHAVRIRTAGLAAAIVSNSEGGDRYWSTRAARRVRRYVVPNAVPLGEIERTPPAPVSHTDVSRRLVLFAGRLDAEKNLDVLLESVRLALLAEDFDFACCGSGPLQVHVSGWIERNGLGHCARLMGFTPELWGLMKRASLLVAPSVFEGSPNVVLEAMACRCPLVVSDIPAHRSLLDDASAVFASLDSPARLAAALLQVLRDPAGARQRAEVASAGVQRFDPEMIARQYLEVYRSVLERKTGESSPRRQRTCVES